MTKYVILNDKGEFYVSRMQWAKEYPDAWEFTGIKVARDKAEFVSDFATMRVRIIADYGMENEREIAEYYLGGAI